MIVAGSAPPKLGGAGLFVTLTTMVAVGDGRAAPEGKFPLLNRRRTCQGRPACVSLYIAVVATAEKKAPPAVPQQPLMFPGFVPVGSPKLTGGGFQEAPLSFEL